MVITKDVTLPTIEDLEIDEVNMSTATLMSASPYIGKQCEGVNNEFILCRQEQNDPRPCLGLGKQVTACAMGVLKCIKKDCLHEFKQYSNCVDKSSGDYSFRHCRRTQKVFDKCMKDKVGVERPEFGYFCRGRVHSSPSATLPSPPCMCPKEPDATPGLPDSKARIPARFGGRLYWTIE